MKHLMKFLVAALILVLAASCAIAEAKLETVFQYRTLLQAVQGTGYIIMDSKQDNTRGLYTTDGKELIPCSTAFLDNLTNDFFNAYDSKEAIDDKTLWKGDGRRIGIGYGAFRVFNSHWVAAFVINPQEVDDSVKDVKINNKNYQYERIDLYYVTDEAGENIEPVASLDREAYKDAAIHGDYIAVVNRENVVSVYDSAFQPVDVTLAAVNRPLYIIDKYQLVSLIDNQILGDGYSEVAEVNLSDRMLIRATRVALDGRKLVCLMDPDGSVILPSDYEIIDITNKWVVVANEEKLQGLFSLEEGRMVVPCVYTAIVSCATDIDKYVHEGYACVEKDGKLGFYDVVNDVESYSPIYSKNALTNIGCSLIFTTLEGDLTVISGDGRSKVVDADSILATRGSGYLLEAKKGTSFGLIDWHGNIIVPIDHYKEIVVTDDTKAIIRTSTGLQLDTVSR